MGPLLRFRSSSIAVPVFVQQHHIIISSSILRSAAICCSGGPWCYSVHICETPKPSTKHISPLQDIATQSGADVLHVASSPTTPGSSRYTERPRSLVSILIPVSRGSEGGKIFLDTKLCTCRENPWVAVHCTGKWYHFRSGYGSR